MRGNLQTVIDEDYGGLDDHDSWSLAFNIVMAKVGLFISINLNEIVN